MLGQQCAAAGSIHRRRGVATPTEGELREHDYGNGRKYYRPGKLHARGSRRDMIPMDKHVWPPPSRPRSPTMRDVTPFNNLPQTPAASRAFVFFRSSLPWFDFQNVCCTSEPRHSACDNRIDDGWIHHAIRSSNDWFAPTSSYSLSPFAEDPISRDIITPIWLHVKKVTVSCGHFFLPIAPRNDSRSFVVIPASSLKLRKRATG
jgi:hypothetical protein